MENTEFFDNAIEEIKSQIKEKTEERNDTDKEIKKLKDELKRKETSKAIYFGEKKKAKIKKVNNEEETKMDDSE